MMIKQKRTGRALSITAGLAWGGIFSLGIVTLGSAITAKLIDYEIMEWNCVGYMILTFLILSAWAGGVVSYRKIKRQKMAVCIMSGILLFAILIMITALFFGGQYNGVGETALLILCGSSLAAFTGSREKKRTRRKIRAYNG